MISKCKDILINNMCNPCKSSKCERVCYGRIGIALFNFLSNLLVTGTSIGEYESSNNIDKDLIVSGHQIYEDLSTSRMLCKIGIPIEKPNRIKPYNNRSPIQIIKDIKGITDSISDEDIQEAIQEVKDLNDGKVMGIPLSLGQVYNIKIDKENKKGRLLSISWNIDKETHKVNCEFNFENSEEKTIIKLSNEDYMTKIIPENIDIIDKQGLIKLTPYGIIKPICVKNKNNTICAVDGNYLYFISNNYAKIIGYWDNNGKLVSYMKNNLDVIDKIKKNERIISFNRRLISPMFITEENMIEI